MSEQLNNQEEKIAQNAVLSIGLHIPLLLGCERQLVGSVIILCISCAFANDFTWKVDLAVIAFYVFTLPIMRYIAKRDPYGTKVAIQHVRYKRFYHARPTVFSVCNKKFNNKLPI